MIRRFFFILILTSTLGTVLLGQSNSNPFELPDRDDQESANPEAIERIPSDNPFDLQESNTKINRERRIESPKKIPTAVVNADSFRIGGTMTLLLSLALLLTLFRGVFNDFFESAYRDRKFNQFYRRMNSIWIAPNILFYLFFFISVAMFANLVQQHYGYLKLIAPIRTIGSGVLGVGIFFVLKHTIVYFLGETFDVSNEAGRYSLLILTFNVILGVLLTPINLLLLLGPDSIKGAIVILGLILCVLVIGLLILRSLSVSNRLLSQHTLHFFMYLCTIEIAPLFIIAKLVI